MARPRAISGFKRLWLVYKRRRMAGFTLIELLVSIIISAIITVGLLALVVELTDANQKDTSRSETQRDMQAALDYIAQDLRTAVFVYDDVCLNAGVNNVSDSNQFSISCPGLVKGNHIPASMTPAQGTTPVLAFWRPDPLPPGLQSACQANATSLDTAAAVQGVPCVSGRSYTLVVYGIKQNQAGDVWQGKTRLVRYQLPQYISSATSATDTTPGYVDPLPSPNSKFQQWPYQIVSGGGVTNKQTQQPSGSGDVLVDFVDTGTGITPQCASATDLTPATATLRGFYACVEGNHLNGPAALQNVNQGVQLVLVGNVAGRSGFPLAYTGDDSRLFPIQTRVLIRGIIDKSPQ